jgi:hypothetical protein
MVWKNHTTATAQVTAELNIHLEDSVSKVSEVVIYKLFAVIMISLEHNFFVSTYTERERESVRACVEGGHYLAAAVSLKMGE